MKTNACKAIDTSIQSNIYGFSFPTYFFPVSYFFFGNFSILTCGINVVEMTESIYLYPEVYFGSFIFREQKCHIKQFSENSFQSDIEFLKYVIKDFAWN